MTLLKIVVKEYTESDPQLQNDDFQERTSSHPRSGFPIGCPAAGTGHADHRAEPASLYHFAAQGASYPFSQTVGISNTGGGTPSWLASVTSGAAFLSLSGATSGTNSGTITAVVSVGSLTPGTYNGNIQVTAAGASNTPRNVPVTLTVGGPVPALPAIRGISNAAGGQTVVAPNAWVLIYGSNFAPADFTDDSGKSIVNGELPTTLDGVSVNVGGQATYVSYVSAVQINVLLPDVGFGSMAVTVTTPVGTSTPVNVNSQQYSAAFFPWPNSQPAATHVDFTPAAKNGTFPGITTVPANEGEVIILWGTGFGPTIPTAPTGVTIPISLLYNTASPAAVMIGSTPASGTQHRFGPRLWRAIPIGGDRSGLSAKWRLYSDCHH